MYTVNCSNIRLKYILKFNATQCVIKTAPPSLLAISSPCRRSSIITLRRSFTAVLTVRNFLVSCVMHLLCSAHSYCFARVQWDTHLLLTLFLRTDMFTTDWNATLCKPCPLRSIKMRIRIYTYIECDPPSIATALPVFPICTTVHLLVHVLSS